MSGERGSLYYGHDDYCALEFYLDRMEKVRPAIEAALKVIEPSIIPAKLKHAMLELARSGALD